MNNRRLKTWGQRLRLTLVSVLWSTGLLIIDQKAVFAEPCVPDEAVDLIEVSLDITGGTEKATPIIFSLIVSNPSDQPIFLCFRTAKRYDFIVSQHGRFVWRWSSGKIFSQVLSEKKLKPGESVRFTQSWPDSDVPSGDYEVTGVLYSDSEHVTVSAVFQIP